MSGLFRIEALWLGLLLTAACSRDLSTPPPPAPGRINGRAVFAIPGRSDLKPAAGTGASLIGSGLSTTTNPAGTFTLTPLEATDGLLHFTFDSDGDGVIDLQKVEQLSNWNTGPNRQVDMGDVVLGENASVRGKVFLADHPGAHSGLSGTAVFVPEGPFAAYTADDGSFSMPNLPEGPLQFFVFRQGYTSKSLGTVTLRAAEDYAFHDIVLSVSTDPPGTGSVVGSLAFSPGATGKGDSAISAQTVTGTPVQGVVAEDLAFHFAALPQGLYTLTATRTGYTRARVFNLLVVNDANVGVVLLTDAPEPDAGQFPAPPDAGTLPDGGACVGANCTACLGNAQCSNTQWCDNGYCAPQCSPSVPCSNGRACDGATKTCVTPCGAGCATGQLCVANLCRAPCDGSFVCNTGFKCDAQNACVPECAVDPDCLSPFKICSAGQCVPKGTCVTDLDCPQDKMCLVGICAVRPTAKVDAGYLCSTACDCKLGEWCSQGVCLADVVPTLYFANDGDGGGTSALAASADLASKLQTAVANDVLALRNGDRFYAAGGFAMQTGRVTVAGGYDVCSPYRWVRSETGRTTLAADAGTVVKIVGTPTIPVDDVHLRNLSFETAADYGCDDDVVWSKNSRRLEVSFSEGGLPATSACSTGINALVQCDGCGQLLVTDVALKPSNARGNTIAGVSLANSDGLIRRVSSQKQAVVHSTFALVQTDLQTGPVVVQQCALPEVSSSVGASGVVATGCQAKTLTVEKNLFAWGRSTSAPGVGDVASVSADGCLDVQVHDNAFDGAQFVGTLPGISSGVRLSLSAGMIERNTVKLPKTSSNTTLSGIVSLSAASVVTVRDNLIVGGDSGGSVTGIRLSQSTVPHLVSGNIVDVGPAKSASGLNMTVGTGGIRVLDNRLSATGNKVCGSRAVGAELTSTNSVFERNRLFAINGATTRALEISGGSQGELYSNHLWAGRSDCAGESSAFAPINVGQMFFTGNTFDVDADPATTARSYGINCFGTTLISDANVISSGKAPTRRMIEANSSSGCQGIANFTRNYFWHDHPAPAVSSADPVLIIVQADAGSFDARGNVLANNLSPFDLLQPDGGTIAPERLAAGSLALDRGPIPKRKDGSDVLDLDKRLRDAGTSADLGCCERF